MHEVRKRGVIFAIHEHVCGGGGVGIYAIAIAGKMEFTGLAIKPKTELVQMEPGTNVKRLRSKE